MKHLTRKISVLIFLILICVTCVNAATTLIPGGQVIGLNLSDGTVTVAKVENAQSPLKAGDKLLSVDETPIRCVEDLRTGLEKGTVSLGILRNGKPKNLTVSGPKLGVYLRQGTAGLGTVTYYDPQTGAFGALGHGVCDTQGNLTQMDVGTVYPASVFSVKPGKIGAPGQLMGSITGQEAIGVLQKNTRQGIFGKITPICAEPLPVADKDEIQTGAATIYSTVSGSTLQEYSVEILKIYPHGSDTRNMLIKITDPALLCATCGIVQGMSGSPVIQNGKLVGAVTHVLVNDPTRGYAIFIENMLETANQVADEQAKKDAS